MHCMLTRDNKIFFENYLGYKFIILKMRSNISLLVLNISHIGLNILRMIRFIGERLVPRNTVRDGWDLAEYTS